MARRIAVNTLNATTMDILNVIRQNASYDYQQNVPEVTKFSDVPKVGEIIYGTPAFANQFINALVNRIALVRVQSATFNNPYSILKKGYLEFGETVEDIFVSIANVVDFNVEKAEKREFKRTIPDVKSAFHTMNWRVMYPVTIQDEDLKQAFLSIDGVQNLIAKIVDSVYTAAENDEFLLFKYLLIKAISHGKMFPTSIGDGTDLKESAVAFRGTSNVLPFMSTKYNESGVKTNTPKERQVIFMDAMFNAQFDVNVLASAFNMGKADFMGRLFLIDDWTTFDNERFEVIREASDGIEEVTADELALLADVKAVILDENWFQVYDNKSKFTEKYVASGMYWNYFYHVWKTVSNSPFANAVVFVTSSTTITPLAEITVEITDKSVSEDAVTLTLQAKADGATLEPNNVSFIQTEALTTAGIAVHPFGALMIPASQVANEIVLECEINGVKYTNAENKVTSANNVGDTVKLTKV
nr:MAG TPA: Head protein [Caudoviricetes sp.]